MSTDVAEFNNITLTQFNAGPGKVKIQITDNHGRFIQLDKRDTYLLIIELTKWIKSQAVKDRERIQAVIASYAELNNSLLKDAVDCEKFIEQLNIIDLPLRLLELK